MIRQYFMLWTNSNLIHFEPYTDQIKTVRKTLSFVHLLFLWNGKINIYLFYTERVHFMMTRSKKILLFKCDRYKKEPELKRLLSWSYHYFSFNLTLYHLCISLCFFSYFTYHLCIFRKNDDVASTQAKQGI